MFVCISGTVARQAITQDDRIITTIRKSVGQDVEFYRLSFPRSNVRAESLSASSQISVSGELSFVTEGEKIIPTIRICDPSFV